jgi:hypothetical protein
MIPKIQMIKESKEVNKDMLFNSFSWGEANFLSFGKLQVRSVLSSKEENNTNDLNCLYYTGICQD